MSSSSIQLSGGPLDDLAAQFAAVATQFCKLVDDASSLDRTDFLKQIYQILPKLMDLAISLPDPDETDDEADEEDFDDENAAPPKAGAVATGHEEWKRRYAQLTNVLGDWDKYREVFNPYRDADVIYGSLADDLADIYSDLYKPLSSVSMSADEKIWNWQFSFQTHWGHHAIDALRAIHARLWY